MVRRRGKRVPHLRRLVIDGFKCFRDRQEIRFGRLTILAGANSSGKTSAMQPLLLLKQTLERQPAGDPTFLLLDGPNVRFSDAREVLWRGLGRQEQKQSYRLVLELESQTASLQGHEVWRIESEYHKARIARGAEAEQIQVKKTRWQIDDAQVLLVSADKENFARGGQLLPSLSIENRDNEIIDMLYSGFVFEYEEWLLALAHLPGLRGTPRRLYEYIRPAKSTFSSPFLRFAEYAFQGVATDYMASILVEWSPKKDKGEANSPEREKRERIGECLKRLDVSWKVHAKLIDATTVRVDVGRTARSGVGGGWDLVNIADAGLGVSQVLPIVVILEAAGAGQLVYIEQPEIHLHPNAQVRLADILVDAANRGVQVVAETHSPLLLVGIQKAVAEGKIKPDDVALNWFERKEDGSVTVTQAEVQEDGSYGEWPVDFFDVSQKAYLEYLRAVLGASAAKSKD